MLQLFLVLILVLLELTLLPKEDDSTKANIKQGFNPCFIGTYSITGVTLGTGVLGTFCFNPCFIGTYSITTIEEYDNIFSSMF